MDALDAYQLLDLSLDLLGQAGVGKPAKFAGIFVLIGAALLGIVLFFTGVLGRISEAVGSRMERSNNGITRSIGKWLVDRDPEVATPAAKLEKLDSDRFGGPGNLPLIYSREVLLSAALKARNYDQEEESEAERQALARARKYLQDFEEDEALIEAYKTLPWLEEHLAAQVELIHSREELQIRIGKESEHDGRG